MKDLENAKWILQIEIMQSDDQKKVTFSQSQYIEDIFEHHGIADCCLVKTPIKSCLSISILSKPKFDITTYQQLIGSLIYVIVCIHSDISYTVGIVAYHIAVSCHVHIKTVKYIFHYLHGTLDYKLTY